MKRKQNASSWTYNLQISRFFIPERDIGEAVKDKISRFRDGREQATEVSDAIFPPTL